MRLRLNLTDRLCVTRRASRGCVSPVCYTLACLCLVLVAVRAHCAVCGGRSDVPRPLFQLGLWLGRPALRRANGRRWQRLVADARQENCGYAVRPEPTVHGHPVRVDGLARGSALRVGDLHNVRRKFPSAFWAGNLFWPIANFINFRFLGPEHRVAYVAACGAIWNTYISWLNHRREEQVRKRPFGGTQNRSFYQDRLWTNRGKR